jgi:hypothetical protein
MPLLTDIWPVWSEMSGYLKIHSGKLTNNYILLRLRYIFFIQFVCAVCHVHLSYCILADKDIKPRYLITFPSEGLLEIFEHPINDKSVNFSLNDKGSGHVSISVSVSACPCQR